MEATLQPGIKQQLKQFAITVFGIGAFIIVSCWVAGLGL